MLSSSTRRRLDSILLTDPLALIRMSLVWMLEIHPTSNMANPACITVWEHSTNGVKSHQQSKACVWSFALLVSPGSHTHTTGVLCQMYVLRSKGMGMMWVRWCPHRLRLSLRARYTRLNTQTAVTVFVSSTAIKKNHSTPLNRPRHAPEASVIECPHLFSLCKYIHITFPASD